MNPKKITYPFRPKSNRNLIPGQFWAIPLSNGRFACGRVIQVPPAERKDTRGFLAGLMDWSGSQPPVSENLTGCRTIKQGEVHIRAISELALDGMILGHRPLELDGIQADLYRSLDEPPGQEALLRGYVKWRDASVEEARNYGYKPTLGYMVLQSAAEDLFGGGRV